MKRMVATWLVGLGIIVAGAVQTHNHNSSAQLIRVAR